MTSTQMEQFPLRVVQWTTGNVGKRSVRAVASNPALELVGCYAWSPDKVGRDVGELAGIEPLGVAATDDIDALIELEPDCVIYNPMWPNVDHLVRILSAGVNVVTTAAFITGHSFGDGRDRIIDACERGGSTIFGSGINPGFVEMMAVMSSTICDRIDKITITESGDSTLLRFSGDRNARGLRSTHRQPRPAGDDGGRHMRVPRRITDDGRCIGCRT